MWEQDLISCSRCTLPHSHIWSKPFSGSVTNQFVSGNPACGYPAVHGCLGRRVTRYFASFLTTHLHGRIFPPNFILIRTRQAGLPSVYFAFPVGALSIAIYIFTRTVRLFSEYIVDLLHNPICPLNRSRNHCLCPGTPVRSSEQILGSPQMPCN